VTGPALASVEVQLEERHTEALQRIAEADASWADKGNVPRVFRLAARGGMRFEIDHPGWEDNSPAPAASTIDDLGEADLLRVEPHEPTSTERTFELTLAGRNVLSGGDEPPKNPVGFS
jgi:hypothetical protein